MRACAYCGEPLADPPSTVGRPTSYCSLGCRRASQSERQRIMRRLERLEDEQMNLRHIVRRGDRTHVWSPTGSTLPAERLKDVGADIAELRMRLRRLLALDEAA